jgi:leucyl/phenylalanyl-tRNA--protein transferase
MRSPQITWISSDDPPEAFPDIDRAFDAPDGLLAAGGDLSEARLLYAYRHGIFPWFNEGQPILWWSPDPRCVIVPRELHVSRRLRRSLRRSDFNVRFNTDFDAVVTACAGDRPGQDGTWITPEMHTAYRGLNAAGWAHSIEIWRDETLVGGLYGLAIGAVFFGESMFSRVNDASKAAMLALCSIIDAQGFALLDCQVESPHLMNMGAELITRHRFADILERHCSPADPFAGWPPGSRNITDFLP